MIICFQNPIRFLSEPGFLYYSTTAIEVRKLIRPALLTNPIFYPKAYVLTALESFISTVEPKKSEKGVKFDLNKSLIFEKL